MIRTYRITDLAEYINWLYFFHAWGLPPKMASVAKLHGCEACRIAWIETFSEADREKARQASKLFADAGQMLARLTPFLMVKAAVELFPANADGDDIVLFSPQDENEEVGRLPMLRQQSPGNDGFCRSLADYIRPLRQGQRDRIGLFAVAAHNDAPMLSASRQLTSLQPDLSTADGYEQLLIQTLSDRLAEAAAEVLHMEVRRTLWGYAPDEQLTIDELHAETYQGIRPAVGYPSLPDLSLNFVLDTLLDFNRVGITLTEHAMMQPHASVSGLMMAHPEANYFSVGPISEEQLVDYAQRRKLPVNTLRTYLQTR